MLAFLPFALFPGEGESMEKNLLISVSQLEEIKTERNGNFLLNIFRDPN